MKCVLVGGSTVGHLAVSSQSVHLKLNTHRFWPLQVHVLSACVCACVARPVRMWPPVCFHGSGWFCASALSRFLWTERLSLLHSALLYKASVVSQQHIKRYNKCKVYAGGVCMSNVGSLSVCELLQYEVRLVSIFWFYFFRARVCVSVCVLLAQGSADGIIDYPVKVSTKAPATVKVRTRKSSLDRASKANNGLNDATLCHLCDCFQASSPTRI